MRLRTLSGFIGLFGILCLFFLLSCAKQEEITFVRLDQQLFSAKTPAQIQAFLNQNPSVAQLYFNANEAGNDTALVRELTERVNNPALNEFSGQLQTQFGDLSNLNAQLSEAFTNIKKDFPDFRTPKVVTIVSGFLGPDLVVTDSLIVIGLDYFAGPTATYRPKGPEYPAYILRRYQEQFIAPAITNAISSKYNATNPADQSLLADMVFYGKSYVFTKTMLPNIADSLVIGYTDKQLTETFNAQDLVWGHFIDNQLLYQTNPSIKQRYLNERPYTAEIGSACPGAIGRWVGWRIVGLYHDKHASVGIADLMRNADAKQIFAESSYKGQQDED